MKHLSSIFRHHVAILHGPHIHALMTGQKKIECRLGRDSRPPFGCVSTGDWVWFKQPSGPIRLLARVGRVLEMKDLEPGRLTELRARWGRSIRAPESFWRDHAAARRATLLWLGCLFAVEPFPIIKRDRRAWVVLAAPPVPGQPLAIHSCVPREKALLDPRGGT
jgi:hypothetical protein